MNQMLTVLPEPVEEVHVIDGGFFVLEPNPFRRSETVFIDGLPVSARLDAYVARAREELPAALHDHLEVYIGEHCIEPSYWSMVTPKADQTVYIRVRPRGKSVKNILRAVLMIAIVVAATVFLGPTGGFIAKTLALKGTMAAIVSGVLIGAATLVGTMLVNALIPAPGLTAEPSTRDPRFQLSGSSNRMVPYGKIPRVMGKIRMFPMLAAQPYTEIVGKDQFLRMLLVVGWGPVKVTDIRIGDTALSNYIGAEVQITEGGPNGWAGNNEITLFNRDVTENGFNIETFYNTPTIAQTTPLDTVEISVDIGFPQGLIEWTKKGAKESRTVSHLVQYRAVGSGTWLTPSFEYDYTGQSGGGGVITTTGNTQDVYRATARWKVAKGQYEVRVTRQTPAGTQGGDSNQIDQSYWTTLRSFADSAPVLQDGLCLIALRLKATDQLNGVPDRISCLAEAYLPTTTNGTTWTYALTRSPAWAYLDLLRRRATETFIPDARIDIASIMAWATDCDATAPNATEPRWTFDAVLEGGSVFEALRQVAAIGRGSFTIKDGLYSVVRDVPQTVPVQHITPRNSWGYQGMKSFVDLPHALKVEFQNMNEDYRMDERYVYADGYNEANATKFEVLQLFGATSPTLVYREARYHLAVGKLRPEEHSVSMDIEALRCVVGSRVELSHDVIVVGSGFGRIESRTVVGPNVTELILDSPVNFEAAKTYQLRARHSDGSSSIRTVTSPGGAVGEFDTVILTPEPSGTAPMPGDLFMFGETNLVTSPMIVKRIEPGDDLSCKLSLVQYDPAIYTADTGTIPAFTSYMSALPNNNPPGVPTVQLRSEDSAVDVASDGTVLTRLAVDIRAALNSKVGVSSFEVQFRAHDPAGPGLADWSDAGTWPASTTTVWINNVRLNGQYKVRVRALGYSGLNSAWVEVGPHTVTGKAQPPAQPTAPSVTAGYRAIYVRWTNPLDLDLDFVEVWASQTNNFASAVLIGKSKQEALLHTNLTADGLPWYYWLVAVDTSGNAATQIVAGNAIALSISDYEGIGDDGVVTPWEKLQVIREYNVLTSEQTALVSAATTAGVSSTAYTTALSALTTYLTGLSPAWNDTTQATNIVRATWNTKWQDVYTTKMSLQSAIDNATTAGPQGPPGVSVASVFIYQRSGSTPTLPSVSTTYTFATGILTGLNNGWTQAVPAGSNPLYVSVATASAAAATDSIPAGEWSAPVVMAQNGSAGSPGTPAISGMLTNEQVEVLAYQNGVVASYANATGTFQIYSGATEVGADFTLSTVANPQSLTVNYSGRTYTVTGGFDAGEDSASLTIRATGSGAYAGVTLDKTFTLTKAFYGYEIGAALPATNLFDGRMFYLTTDKKLYRYNGSAWTAAVPTTDLTGQIAAGQIADGAVALAKFASGIEPVTVVTSVPGVKSTNAILNTTDGKLYRWNGSAYTASVPTADLSGQIANAQIAAGAVTAAKMGVGVGGNMLMGALPNANPHRYFAINYNPDGITYATNAYGGNAIVSEGSPFAGGQTVGNNWTLPDYSTHAIYQPNATTGAAGFAQFLYQRQVKADGTVSLFYGVEVGKTYEFSVYSGAHRCRVDAMLFWFDSAFTYLGDVVGTNNNAEFSGGTTLDGYKRIVARGAAPANAKFVAAGVRKYHTSTGVDSWVFLTRPMLTETVANATEITPWAPPPEGFIHAEMLQAGSIAAAKIAAGAIETDKLAAGAITTAKLATDSVTAAQIAAGAVNASEIAARAITASKLELFPDNMIADPYFRDLDYWQSYLHNNWTPMNFTGGGWYRERANQSGGSQTNATAIGASEYAALWDGAVGFNAASRYLMYSYSTGGGGKLDLKPGKVYEVKAGAKNASNQSLSCALEFFDDSNAYLTGQGIVWSAGETAIKSVQVTAPATTAWGRLVIYNEGGSTFVGANVIGAPMVREAHGATLVIDGAISAQKIAAQAITASKLAIGDINNYLLNGDMRSRSLDGWCRQVVTNGGDSITTNTGSNWPSATALYFTRANGNSGELSITNGNTSFDDTDMKEGIDLAPNDELWFEGVVFTTSVNTPVLVDCVSRQNTSTITVLPAYALSNCTVSGSTALTASGSFTRFTGYFKNTTGATSKAYIRIAVGSNSSGSPQYVYMWNMKALRRNKGELIVDGAIVANKLAADSVTANAIEAGAVTAGKISVTQLSAINANVGLLRTASSGQRVEIEANQMRVYDSGNTMRVRIGIW